MKSWIAFLALGLLVSCVKDPQDIPGSSGDGETFGIQGSFGNEQVMIGAGINQWTNLPVVEMGDSLLAYTSVFSKDGCIEQCNNAWTFRFFQVLPTTGDPQQDFDNTLQIGDKAFVASLPERTDYHVLLSTHPGLFMNGYSYWEDIGHPSTSFFHEFQTVAGFEENIDVCFQSHAYTGCKYKQCITFDPATEKPCLLRIEPRLENPNYLSLNVRPQGTAPFDVLWSNGTTTQSRVIPLQDSIAEIYADVTVVDALGNRSRLTQTIRLQNGAVDGCYFPISLTSNPKLNNSPELYADRVEIEYVDEAGEIWISSGGVQPQSSSLTIDAKSFFGPSPFQQASYLVDLTARVTLFNTTSGESKVFSTQQLSVALSHP